MYEIIKIRRKVPITYKVFNKDNVEFVDGYVQQVGVNIEYNAGNDTWLKLMSDDEKYVITAKLFIGRDFTILIGILCSTEILEGEYNYGTRYKRSSQRTIRSTL